MATIKILLAERAEVFRRGLVDVLRDMPNIELVAVCEHGPETLQKSVELNPDIVLMDEGILGCDFIELSHRIKEQLPHARIVIITTPHKETSVRVLLRAESTGYIDKDISVEAINRVFNRVYEGNACMPPRIAQKLLRDFVSPEEILTSDQPRDGADGIKLSKREIEVLALVAKGDRNKEIASKLCISENTVKGHLSIIMDKMHVRNRMQAAAVAREKGIVSEVGGGQSNLHTPTT